jgi:Fic family protein
MSNRGGFYVRQPTGYSAFSPQPLPPDPAVAMSQELLQELSRADRCLARLDGASDMLPDPDAFVAAYVRKEALLSSQIEGTQASISELLSAEAESARTGSLDIGEVYGYLRALNFGLSRLGELPVSLRLIREIHAELLAEGRGSEKTPGQFRTSQNWIGPSGSSLANARFVPPPPSELMTHLGAWESFIHDPAPMPELIKVGLIHAQFETIHPFLDGNGRVGRLLITFLLCQMKILRRPLLYLSHYFKVHRTEYYDRLQATRDKGDWEGWTLFFLRGVAEVAQDATELSRRIISLREEQRGRLMERGSRTRLDSLKALELFYSKPHMQTTALSEALGCSFVTAQRAIADLVSLGLVQEITGRRRSRIYANREYVDLLDDDVMQPDWTEQQSQ